MIQFVTNLPILNMKIDVPDWLIKMANEMRVQDNRCTVNPVYVVKERIPFYLDEYSDFSIPNSSYVKDVYTNTEDTDDGLSFYDTEEELIKYYKEELDYDEEDLDDMEIREYHMYEMITSRATFLTEKEAQDLIDTISYKLSDPFIYVESAHESYELKRLMDWIISLGDSEMYSKSNNPL